MIVHGLLIDLNGVDVMIFVLKTIIENITSNSVFLLTLFCFCLSKTGACARSKNKWRSFSFIRMDPGSSKILPDLPSPGKRP